MTSDHEAYADWSAAYLLGALEPAERSDYQRHLGGCDICQRTVADFSTLPGLLARADPTEEDLAATKRVTEAAVKLTNDHYARTATRADRWKTTALVAAAALLLVVGLQVNSSFQSATRVPGGIELAFVSEASGTVTVEQKPWGTRIDLDLDGLPQRESYQLWAVDVDGNWASSATWAPTPTGKAVLVSATAASIDNLDRIVITSVDVDDVLVDATR